MTSRFAKLSGASGLIRSPFTKPSAISSQLKIATRPCTRLRFRKEIAVRVRKSHKLQIFSQIDLVRPGSLKECRAWRPTTTPLWDPTIVPSARTKGVCLLGDRERLGRFREGNCGAGDSISWRRQRAHRCNDAQSDSRARGSDCASLQRCARCLLHDIESPAPQFPSRNRPRRSRSPNKQTPLVLAEGTMVGSHSGVVVGRHARHSFSEPGRTRSIWLKIWSLW